MYYYIITKLNIIRNNGIGPEGSEKISDIIEKLDKLVELQLSLGYLTN